jgi:predicted transcriptional regulator
VVVPDVPLVHTKQFLPFDGPPKSVAKESPAQEFLVVTECGLSDRLLSERLRELESEGLVKRTVREGPPVRVSYELTPAGASLKPVVDSLGRWAQKWVKL